jgi:ribosomal protein S18 acetylase RimI-like enzyme
MNMQPALDEIIIRTELKPGDLGYVIHRHGALYKQEYEYGIEFETYVAAGLCEFYKNYDPARDRIWISEYHSTIVGFLLLMHRPGNAAQLRYFLIEPAYRGIGLGKKMLDMYMDFYSSCKYDSSYLWTTHEQDTAAFLYKRRGFILTEEKDSNAFGKPLKEQRYDLAG